MSATAEFLSDVSNPKRHAIMAAAAELFMAEGYAAVSMDAVAKTSGVSKATLYAHFSGKEALFEAIVAAGCEHMREQAEEFLGGHDRPLREALVELGLHWLRFMLRRQVRALHRVMIAEGVRFPALARAFYAAGPQAMHSWLSGWMAGELARGRLRPEVRPAQAAEHFLSLLRGDLFVRATLGLVGEDAAAAELQGIAEQVADTFLRLHGVPADGFA